MRHGVVCVAAVVGCAAILLPIAAAPAPLPRPARPPKDSAVKRDQAKLQGTWYTASIAYPGGHGGEDRRDTITYQGDRYTQRQNGQVYQAGTFAIVDATASPRQIDYRCTEGDLKGKRFRSIYTLDG